MYNRNSHINLFIYLLIYLVFFNSLCSSAKTKGAPFLAVIGPICSSAKLQLNPKPEQPDESGKSFSIPFVSLDFVMDELAVGKSPQSNACLG